MDEFADNDSEATAADADLQMGTSGRAGVKLLRDKGLIDKWLNADNVGDIRAWHLAGLGGVIMGLNWMTGMMTTDSEGFIVATGVVEGGHEVESIGWSDHVTRHGALVRAIRIQNSWSKTWGVGGRAWLSEDDLARLLADQGDAIAAIEIKHKI